MGSDDFDDRGDFWGGKPELLQEGRRRFGGVGNVVPGRQRRQIFRTMANEDAEVVQPGRCIEHVVIEGLIFGKLRGQAIKPGLMAELVGRFGLRADVISNGISEHTSNLATGLSGTRFVLS